jgi:hypothetical protein
VGDAVPLAAYGCGHDTGWSDVAVQSGMQGIRFWLQVICNQDLRRHRSETVPTVPMAVLLQASFHFVVSLAPCTFRRFAPWSGGIFLFDKNA